MFNNQNFIKLVTVKDFKKIKLKDIMTKGIKIWYPKINKMEGLCSVYLYLCYMQYAIQERYKDINKTVYT